VGEAALRLHSSLPHSRANGPGARAVVWVQSCSLGCPGCFNPQTHSPTGGELVGVDDLFRRVAELQDRIEGVTVSGGEPLQQLPALLGLLERLRAETALSAIVFTGYAWEEVQAFPESPRLLACVDVLLAGRYDARRRLAEGLRGSANKTVHLLTARYRAADLEAVPAAEVHIGPAGELEVSGIDPPRWRLPRPEPNP
jgi:anaerobic ribonucleoside-triphosphate reductase activating protein